jgi:radical SAM protein with 4Fe4S-binding SPASM domain
VNDQTYAEFSRALRRRASAGHIPLNGSIEVTHRCSLDCEHCYNNLPMSDAGARATELSADELKRIVAEIADAGGLYLLFTGGEIFARKDFLGVYKYAKSLGFIVSLFSNGTLITERIADELARDKPFVVEITLYGHSEQTYERLTGIRGSFERVRKGIRLLVDRGVKVRLKTVGVTHTFAEIADMNAFALAEVGAPLKFDSLINGRVDGPAGASGKRSPASLRLAPERIVQLDVRDPRRVAGWKDVAQLPNPTQTTQRGHERYHCGGGITSYAIDPQGKLSICVLSKREQFDLREGSFADGWQGFLRRVRAQTTERETKCTACSLKSVCGMCPAMGELESGDPDEPVDFLCEVAHLRAAVLGLPVAVHGNCEYCPGGSRHEALLAAATRVHEGKIQTPVRRSLPVVASDAAAPGEACGSGGCGACQGG